MQQEPLSTANGLCERLLVRAESLRIGVCQAGMQYRHFFAWLLRTVRRLNDDNPQAATEAAAIKVDPTNVAAFLQGQFCRDAIGPEIKVRMGYSSAGHRYQLVNVLLISKFLCAFNRYCMHKYLPVSLEGCSMMPCCRRLIEGLNVDGLNDQWAQPMSGSTDVRSTAVRLGFCSSGYIVTGY